MSRFVAALLFCSQAVKAKLLKIFDIESIFTNYFIIIFFLYLPYDKRRGIR